MATKTISIQILFLSNTTATYDIPMVRVLHKLVVYLNSSTS